MNLYYLGGIVMQNDSYIFQMHERSYISHNVEFVFVAFCTIKEPLEQVFVNQIQRQEKASIQNVSFPIFFSIVHDC